VTSGVFTNLYSFTGASDGSGPNAGLVQGTDGYLYGTTHYGGAYTNQSSEGNGTIFQISTNGALTTLYSFTGGSDGGNPAAALVQGADGNFYGTTSAGGSYTNQNSHGTWGYGTVFSISTNGTLTSLYSFTGGSDGANPQAGLVQARDGGFYGTTAAGGQGGFGTVFRLAMVAGVPPQLTLTAAGQSVVLTWPTNATGFTLQSAANLDPTAVWIANLPSPVIVNDQNVVTNPIAGPQQFFRLSQ